jgi:hypothetical protein
MSTTAPWEQFLSEHFPGYLLPESHRTRIEADEAARFLERLTGEQQRLRVRLGACRRNPPRSRSPPDRLPSGSYTSAAAWAPWSR